MQIIIRLCIYADSYAGNCVYEYANIYPLGNTLLKGC